MSTMQFLAQVRQYRQGNGFEEAGCRRVRLSYDATDPYAVTLEVSHCDTWPRWVLDRSLLIYGPARGAGEGDVHIRPASERPGQRVAIVVRTGADTWLELTLRRAEIDAAVDRFDAIVPNGGESDLIDWDTELSALLGGGDLR